jgi:uncharacterized protein YndB with AHSA1/START domain
MSTMSLVGRTVEKELFIAAAPERVYRALTNVDDLKRWFVTNAEVKLQPGGVFNLYWQQENVKGEVVESDPPHRLTFTWDERPAHGITTCTIELTPEADGTLLRLAHTGFLEGDNWDDLYNGVNTGWTSELGNLKTWLETGAEKVWD